MNRINPSKAVKVHSVSSHAHGTQVSCLDVSCGVM